MGLLYNTVFRLPNNKQYRYPDRVTYSNGKFVDQFDKLEGLGFIPDKGNSHSFKSASTGDAQASREYHLRVGDLTEIAKKRRLNPEEASEPNTNASKLTLQKTPTKSGQASGQSVGGADHSEASNIAAPTTPKASGSQPTATRHTTRR